MEIKIWVYQIFKICYDFIKNNSFINLGDWGLIRIVWSLVMQQKHNVYYSINLATGRPDTKTLTKYNNNSLEKNDEEEKEPINIDLTEQKADHYNNENAIHFRWSDVNKEDKDIALTNLNESLLKQTDEEFFFQKSNWMIVWWLRYRT